MELIQEHPLDDSRYTHDNICDSTTLRTIKNLKKN